MASEKLKREDIPGEYKVRVERDTVPKLTTHFESFVEKAKGSDVPSGVTVTGEERRQGKGRQEGTTSQLESLSRKIEQQQEREEGKEKEGEMGSEKGGETEEGEVEKENGKKDESVGEERKQLSREDISKYRQTSQQNSMDTIRAAEERFKKAIESPSSAVGNVQESATHGLGTLASTVTDTVAKAKDTIVQNINKTTELVAEKASAVKETVAEKAQKPAEDKDYTQQTEEAGKEKVPSIADRVGGYAGEKAVAAKDAVVETGKSAAGYVEDVTMEVKGRSVVAWWESAEYVSEKMVDATKKAVDVTKGVTGYAGEMAVAGKDATAQGAQRAAEYTGEKVAVVKDKMVEAEESVKVYAARKKAEAESDLEARRSKGETVDRDTSEEAKGLAQVIQKPTETVEEFFEGVQDDESSGEEGGKYGVLEAIGETIVEIAETTKKLVLGEDKQETKEDTRMEGYFGQ